MNNVALLNYYSHFVRCATPNGLGIMTLSFAESVMTLYPMGINLRPSTVFSVPVRATLR